MATQRGTLDKEQRKLNNQKQSHLQVEQKVNVFQHGARFVAFISSINNTGVIGKLRHGA